jgi:AcrR family transcriptional regulator
LRESPSRETGKAAESVAGAALVDRRPQRKWAHRSRSGHLYPSAQQDLAPAARRLLEAARGLLSESGFSALKVEAIATAAGERKSLIHYYFGGKSGFLVALLDWLFDDTNRDIRARVAALPPGRERLRSLVIDLLRIASDRTANREYFELLPHLLANEDMRQRLAGLYLGYEAMLREALPIRAEGAVSDAQISAAARLVIALVEGYAIQLLADPERPVAESDTRLWQHVLENLLTPPVEPSEQAEDREGGDGFEGRI